MRSDNVYERLFKLLGSLCGLILEEKRHLETVCATFQKLVFEAHGRPRFKNWPEICKLGETNHLMMLAIATADLSKNDDATHQMVAAFPQCFCVKKVHGPYPLSLIRTRAEAECRRQQSGHKGADRPQSFDAIPEDVPCHGFDTEGRNVACGNLPRLPEGIDPDAPQGAVVMWEGREFVVMENNRNCEELWIVPSECIDVDV